MKVLVTGANRGIGAALRARMLGRGDDVIGTARQVPGGPDWRALDVRDAAPVARLAEGMGPLDLLVCNAGVYLDKGHGLDGFPPEMWAETFAVNVTGVFLTIQTLLPQLKAAKGKIAILSSTMASQEAAPGGSYIYRASKAAVLNVGRNLAQDLKGDGVAVGIYHPGWVRTDMGGGAADIGTEEAAEGLVQRFGALSLASTGCFETWDGRQHPF